MEQPLPSSLIRDPETDVWEPTTTNADFGSADAMQKLLEAEGVRIVDDCVVDFERLFWDPAQEILL